MPTKVTVDANYVIEITLMLGLEPGSWQWLVGDHMLKKLYMSKMQGTCTH